MIKIYNIIRFYNIKNNINNAHLVIKNKQLIINIGRIFYDKKK